MNKNKKLILIEGKTSSGKDTVAKYIKDKYNIDIVVSYTTRGMRDYEVDGIQHYFVSEERMREIVENEDIIAYTKFPKTNIEYCATLDAIKSDIAVYIINPEGVRWFKENGCSSSTDFISIYVELDENLIIERAKNRGDNLDDILKRLDSERDEFNNFRDSKSYDYIIDNSGSYEELLDKVDTILSNEGICKNL